MSCANLSAQQANLNNLTAMAAPKAATPAIATQVAAPAATNTLASNQLTPKVANSNLKLNSIA